eukprot:12935018-Prorocentrum_lima.AAC.1
MQPVVQAPPATARADLPRQQDSWLLQLCQTLRMMRRLTQVGSAALLPRQTERSAQRTWILSWESMP